MKIILIILLITILLDVFMILTWLRDDFNENKVNIFLRLISIALLVTCVMMYI